MSLETFIVSINLQFPIHIKLKTVLLDGGNDQIRGCCPVVCTHYLTLQLTINQMPGETGVAYCTNLYFNSILRILNMLQCCINI